MFDSAQTNGIFAGLLQRFQSAHYILFHEQWDFAFRIICHIYEKGLQLSCSLRSCYLMNQQQATVPLMHKYTRYLHKTSLLSQVRSVPKTYGKQQSCLMSLNHRGKDCQNFYNLFTQRLHFHDRAHRKPTFPGFHRSAN